MPFCAQLSTLMACSAITGITMGFLDTGGNVWCLDLWGRHSAPFMQGLHFCFALGALVAPLIAEPFLSPSGLVGTLQHVQPLHPGNSSLPVDNFGHIPSIGIHHGIAVNRPLPNTFVLGATPGFFEHDRPRRRRRNAKQTTPLPRLSELNNATERGTDVSVQPRIQQLLSNTVPSTSTSSSTAGIPSTVRAPSPITTSSAPTSSWTVSMQPRVLETLPPSTLSSVSASSSTASPATSAASSSPEPTLVSNTWNSSSAGEANGNGTDVVQSRMDNDNTTVSSTSASADVTTAAKKPTKPLYAEGAAAKKQVGPRISEAEPTAVGARAETECGSNGQFQHLCKRYREWKRVDDSLECHLLVVCSSVDNGPEFKLSLFVGYSFVDGDTDFELRPIIS
uniref:Putative mucin-5ac n=1 Tax=Ixodes ricinus TaxID=34613 RepID=A0A6B0VBU2_IXORI